MAFKLYINELLAVSSCCLLNWYFQMSLFVDFWHRNMSRGMTIESGKAHSQVFGYIIP